MHSSNIQASNPTPTTQSSGDASDPTPQPGQADMPPEHELMELDIPDDIPDIIDVPEEVLSDFDAWTNSMLDYGW